MFQFVIFFMLYRSIWITVAFSKQYKIIHYLPSYIFKALKLYIGMWNCMGKGIKCITIVGSMRQQWSLHCCIYILFPNTRCYIWNKCLQNQLLISIIAYHRRCLFLGRKARGDVLDVVFTHVYIENKLSQMALGVFLLFASITNRMPHNEYH